MVIRAVVFDAYGTLYDVHSVRTLADELLGERGELVTQLWRIKQLEYTWLRTLMRAYGDFDSVTRAALEYALASVGVEPAAGLCSRLMDRYRRLDLFEEAEQAIASLQGYKLAILSNGSPDMLESLVSASKLAGRFDAIISVDPVNAYKPDPACYALAAPALGVDRREVLFVSSNGFDVAGAKHHGFKVAWVDRGADLPLAKNSGVGPDELYRLIRARTEKLGYEPDLRVTRLTDLPALVCS